MPCMEEKKESMAGNAWRAWRRRKREHGWQCLASMEEKKESMGSKLRAWNSRAAARYSMGSSPRVWYSRAAKRKSSQTATWTASPEKSAPLSLSLLLASPEKASLSLMLACPRKSIPLSLLLAFSEKTGEV